MDKTEQLKLFAYLESLFDDKLSSLWTSQPATIKTFDPAENTVSCTLDKEGITLDDIPISLFGNPQSYITTPTLEAGTKGILLFSKHDLFSWIESGSDPDAKTDFSKNNAFFLIGATNQQNKITYNMNAIEIKTDKAVEIKSVGDSSIASDALVNMTAGSAITMSAPKTSITDSDSGEELFDLLVQAMNDLSALSTVLVNYGISGASTYPASFTALSQKYGGFQ